MRHNTPVTTLAATLALALALLLGVLLPIGQLGSSRPLLSLVPVTAPRGAVPENTPPGVNIGAPVLATDLDEDR